MNTTAIITVAGTFLTAIGTIILGAFVRRGDRSAKVVKQYFDDALYNMDLVSALREDYWGVHDWALSTRSKWHALVFGLPRVVAADNRDQLQEFLQSIGDLPPLPEPKHREMERLHARARREAKADED